MRISCQHGFFRIDEVKPGQVGRFISIFGLQLVAWRGVFTFPVLATVPEYSVKGAAFLDREATATFAGRPEEIFEANGIVYDFNTGKTLDLESVTRRARIPQSGNIFVSNGLISPGSILDDGRRAKGFTCFFDVDTMTFRYSEVTRD